MRTLLFEFGGDYILVRIKGNDIQFGNTAYGNKIAPIEGLKLNYNGVIKEHPDLKDNPLWKEEAIKRFKDKVKSLASEEDKAKYVINDLKMHHYIPKYMEVDGFRRVKI